MHIISRKALRLFAQQYPDSKTALDVWFRIIKKTVSLRSTSFTLYLHVPTWLDDWLCSILVVTNIA